MTAPLDYDRIALDAGELAERLRRPYAGQGPKNLSIATAMELEAVYLLLESFREGLGEQEAAAWDGLDDALRVVYRALCRAYADRETVAPPTTAPDGALHCLRCRSPLVSGLVQSSGLPVRWCPGCCLVAWVGDRL